MQQCIYALQVLGRHFCCTQQSEMLNPSTGKQLLHPVIKNKHQCFIRDDITHLKCISAQCISTSFGTQLLFCLFTFTSWIFGRLNEQLAHCVLQQLKYEQYFIRRGLNGHSGRGVVRLDDGFVWCFGSFSESSRRVTWVPKGQTAGERDTQED